MDGPRFHTIAVVYNPDKDRARKEWKRLQRWLKARHLSVIGDTRVTAAMKHANFVVALGGDGTMLRVARGVSRWNMPVLGVNIGRLGFLAATELDTLDQTLTRILAGHGHVEHRGVLSVKAYVRGKVIGPFMALNECVVRSAATGRILILNVKIHGLRLATYVGDGLIVSTPTGSTAYSLSASGPIVHPVADVMLLCPICPHSLMQRPLIVPSSEMVEITVEGPHPAAMFSLDGQANHGLSLGDRVEVRQGTERVTLLTDSDRSFYQVLQSKLKWGGA